MSIWKRGSNLVKGMIAEASKSDDPERMRVLEEELEAEKRLSATRSSLKQKKETEGVRASQQSPTDNQGTGAIPDEEQPLTPKKRTI